MRTRIGVGAAAVLATGSMIGLGVTGASATTAPSTSPSAFATAGASAGGQAKANTGGSLLPALLNIRDNSPQAVGDRAAKIAAGLVNHPQLFAKLPAALQTDLTALKNATPADRVKDAVKIRTTALSGGYGAEFQKRAENLQKTGVQKAGFVQELRTVLRSSNPGAGAQTIAEQVIARKNLFAKLPADLQSDLQGLKSAGPVDVDAQATKIKTTALSGGYGAQIQKIIEHLVAKHTATPAPSAGATS
ncbi:hypothetical protein [Arthrobacter sp. UYEF3]|uniref:hypothetical protein n=1 Tax=Arthrobacter sp. UYEF3 TaxID=1756365 RepID=UPI003394A12C